MHTQHTRSRAVTAAQIKERGFQIFSSYVWYFDIYWHLEWGERPQLPSSHSLSNPLMFIGKGGNTWIKKEAAIFKPCDAWHFVCKCISYNSLIFFTPSRQTSNFGIKISSDTARARLSDCINKVLHRSLVHQKISCTTNDGLSKRNHNLTPS